MNAATPWARRRLEHSLSTRPLIYGGNRIELLRSGAEFFPRLLAAIDAARVSVHLETYIFELDAVGVRVADALQAAAGRGVAVHVLVDAFGSQKAIPELPNAWRRAECVSGCSVPASGGASSGGCSDGCIARWPWWTIASPSSAASTSSTTAIIPAPTVPTSARATTSRWRARVRWWASSRSS